MITRQVIIKDLADKLKCDINVSKDITNAFIDLLSEYLIEWQDVNLPWVWKFARVKRSTKKWINPRTMEVIQVPEYYTIRYRPAVSVKKAINS